MITRCHFVNIRSLRDVTIDFGPFTVLVGPNASGKSTVLNALAGGVLTPATTWQHRVELPQMFEITLVDGRTGTSQRGAGEGPSGHVPLLPTGYYQLLRLDPDRLRSGNVVQDETTLAQDGGNLANVFASLPRRTQAEIAERLYRLVPAIRDVDVRPSGSHGKHAFFFQDRWSDDTWYDPQEVSDGTMLVLAFLVLQHQRIPPSVVGIEEPERGLHPYLVEELVTLLRKLSAGELGRAPIQVIAATHSAQLLDYLRPEEVRFLDRNKDGEVVVYTPPAADDAFQDAMKAYRDSLGSAWLSGSLGGVPGA